MLPMMVGEINSVKYAAIDQDGDGYKYHDKEAEGKNYR
jgi:hypothetical protein